MSTTDKNYQSFAHLRGTAADPIVLHLGVIRPPDDSYADALKFSDCQHVIAWADEIHGGTEDCVDVNNRCHNVAVHARRYYPRGKYVITGKGESSDLLFTGEIHGRGREADVDLGNHSDQAGGRTKGVRLGLTTADRRPIAVRVLHAWAPELLNAESQRYEVDDRAQGWFAHVWRILKKLFGV